MKNKYDAYAKYRYNYKSNSKKRIKKKSVLTVLFVIFSISVVVFFSLAFSNFLVVNKIVNVNSSFITNAKVLYALSLDSANTLVSAKEISEKQQSQGGAGYVYFKNDKYFVISSIYQNSQDCKKVQQNLKKSGLEPEIVEILLPPINLKLNLSSNLLNLFTKAVNLFYENYTNLYSISTEFDKQTLDNTGAKMQIKQILDNNKTIYNDFSKQFSKSSNSSIIYTKIYLAKSNALLEDLLSLTDEKNMSSEIKQTYTKIIDNYLDFTNTFA